MQKTKIELRDWDNCCWNCEWWCLDHLDNGVPVGSCWQKTMRIKTVYTKRTEHCALFKKKSKESLEIQDKMLADMDNANLIFMREMVKKMRII